MTTVGYDPDAFPDALKDRDQWLLWDAVAEVKQPFTLNGYDLAPASWTDPDDWLPFERAHKVASKKESVGVGFVLAKGVDDHAGILGGLDLDGCVNEEGELKEWLPPLEDAFGGAYMEYSQSGTGIHIPLLGFSLPEWWTDVSAEGEHEGVEAYEKKFFVFTGDTLADSAEGLGQIPQEEVNDWLAAVSENITGEDPRETYTPTPSTSSIYEPNKSKSEIAEMESTENYEDVLDAVRHLDESDLSLRSTYMGDEKSGVESWNPAYRQSKSGMSLKRFKNSGKWVDMESMGEGFDVVSLFAAEEGILHNPTEKLEGDDWKEALDRAREAGAPIPDYVGGKSGDLPDSSAPEHELSDEQAWVLWSDSRSEGGFDGSSVVPESALRYIAREHELYGFEDLSEEADSLPAKAHNKALHWVNNVWAEEVGLDEDENATARPYLNRFDAPVWTWEDVRYVYDESKEEGRLAGVSLLRERYEFLTPQDTENLHIYDEDLGIFDKTAKFLIGRELDRSLASHYSQHEKREIMGRLKEETFERSDLEAKGFDSNYICVENGVLDLDERDLIEHDPKYNFTTYLPVEYSEGAESPRVNEFLGEITKREEDAQALLEVLGHALLPNYDFELFMVLFGEGANGKSTWLDVVRKFLSGEGKETQNVQNLSLQSLADNRFAASNLVGAWANIGEDLPEKKIHDLGTLKDLTGGGETWVEPKGKQGFNFRNRATMMFAANRPPILGERSYAVKRRLVPIHLPHRFTSDPDPNDPYEKQAQKEGLVDELTTDAELSGLLNAALDGLDRLRENEDVSLPESYDERLELYERHSDHIKAFRVDCLQNERGTRVQKDDVYNAYTAYCEANDYVKVGRSTFWGQLRQTTLNVSVKRPQRDDGSRPRVLVDAKFAEAGYEFAPEAAVPADVETDEPETESEDSDGAHGASPLSQAAQSLTGYVTVTGEVASTRYLGEDDGGLKAVLRDSSGVMDFVVWEGELVNKLADLEGVCLVIQHAEVSEYDGSSQLSFVEGLTEIGTIQHGVGYTEGEKPEDGQSGLDDASSAMEADGGTVSKSTVPEDAEDANADARRLAEHVGNRLCTKQELQTGCIEEFDWAMKRTEKLIQKALREGLLNEVQEGKYRQV